jgi:hypothetical protein
VKNRKSCSGSFLGLLFLLFLILKLAHVVDWSWWWVTSPLWLPVALTLGGLLLVALLGVTGYKVVTSLGRKRREQAAGTRAETVVEAAGTEVKVAPASGSSATSPPPAAPAAPGLPAPGGSAEAGLDG